MLEVLTASASRFTADPAADCQRDAYNAAFDELGLNWYWDAATYASLLGHSGGCVRHYVETEQPHLLRSYDADFLAAAVEAARGRCLAGSAG